MLLALRKKDEAAMERSFAQLRTYYNDTRSVLRPLHAAGARTPATGLTWGHNLDKPEAVGVPGRNWGHILHWRVGLVANGACQ